MYLISSQDAVGIELWSMSDNILFDNLIVTENIADAYHLAQETFDLKVMKLEKGQVYLYVFYFNKFITSQLQTCHRKYFCICLSAEYFISHIYLSEIEPLKRGMGIFSSSPDITPELIF